MCFVPGMESLLCGSCCSADNVLVLDRDVGGRSVSRGCWREMPTFLGMLSHEDRAGHCRAVTGTLVSLIVPKSLF